MRVDPTTSPVTQSRSSTLPILLLLVGVFCGASSVVMIKASHLHPAVLSAYRLFLAVLLLLPIYLREVHRFRAVFSAREHLLPTLLPGLVLALHLITWTQGAQWTRAANATLIVCMVPVVMPFLLFFTMGEVITKWELLGTAVAMSGAVWLGASDFGVSRQSVLGDITCFISMLLFSYYLVQGRINRGFPSLWLYLVPLYAVAGGVCFLIALCVAKPLESYPTREWLLVLAQAVVPTILGHSILNHAMKQLRGQLVSVVNLFQFLFAGALGYLFFNEVPGPVFYGAGLLVVGGAILVIRALAATPHGEEELAEFTAPPEV